MSTQHAERLSVQAPWPAKTPSAIRAVLAANADAEVIQEYDAALDAAYEQARASSDLQPLLTTIELWWRQACFWTQPEQHKATLAREDEYRRNGLPPKEQRTSREQVIAMLEKRTGRAFGQ